MDPICGPPSSMSMRAPGCPSRTCRATAAPIGPLPTMSTSHSASFLCIVGPSLVIRPVVPHAGASLRVRAEGGVERGLGKLPQEGTDVPLCLLGPVKPIHPRVLPLHQDGPVVSHVAQGAECVLPRDVAVTREHEVPTAPRIPRRGGTQDTLRGPRPAVPSCPCSRRGRCGRRTPR